MNIDNIEKHIKWDKYYDPNFDWDNLKFYENNTLSEKFIEEFHDRINWTYVFSYQKVSESFIEKYRDKIDWLEWFSIQFFQNR